jgi:prephenate dehydrogenase
MTAKMFRSSHVVVLGLGLMGGSLALALRGKCAQITGVDIDPETLRRARMDGAVDTALPSLDALDSGVDIVVLAVPVETSLALIPVLPEAISGDALIMDLGSTKAAVMTKFARLPGRLAVLGGHPMCGKAQGGYVHAEAGLFEGAPFALVRGEDTPPGACALGEALVRGVGARPLWLSAEDHDRWTAGTSHLPFLVSCALSGATPEAFAPLIGPGFCSTTRLADTPLSMMGDILRTNRENILERMDAFLLACQEIRDLYVAKDDEGLFTLLADQARHHRTLLALREGKAEHVD